MLTLFQCTSTEPRRTHEVQKTYVPANNSAVRLCRTTLKMATTSWDSSHMLSAPTSITWLCARLTVVEHLPILMTPSATTTVVHFFFRPSLHRRGCRRTAANSESVWTLKTLKLTMSFRSSCSLITWHRQTCMGRLQRSPERSSCIPDCEKGVSVSSHTINHLRENGRIIMRMAHTSHCARPQRNVFSDRLILLVCAQIWSNNFTFAT